jgi:hypothetical protein
MSSGSNQRRPLAEVLAELGGDDRPGAGENAYDARARTFKTFQDCWVGKPLAVDGRPKNPCAEIEKIPRDAARYAHPVQGDPTMLCVGGLESLVHWYDVHVSSVPVPVPSRMKTPAGRPPLYDWSALKTPIEEYVASNGHFRTATALAHWCIDRVEPKKGARLPKGSSGDGASMKAAKAAILTYGLDAIGLAPPA